MPSLFRGLKQLRALPPLLLSDAIFVFLLLCALFADLARVIPVPDWVFIGLVIFGIIPVAYNTIRGLLRRELTIDLLAAVALSFAFFAKEWHSAAFINLMLAFARMFDVWTTLRTTDIVRHLMKYRPSTVKIEQDGKVIEIPIEKVAVGDHVVIGAGDRLPVDGTVLSGQASMNQATLTGESEPVTKKVGDIVLSSTLNESGSLLVRADKVGQDTTLSKIIALIEEASRKKARFERVATRFTAWYVLATLVGAVGLYLYGRQADFVLAILLVVCADDIAVAVPLSFTVAIARAAQKGILIKGSGVLEKVSRINYFMTDKTGTLTYGKPEVQEIIVFPGAEEGRVLKWFGAAEVNSKHPTGGAIMRYLEKRGVRTKAPEEFLETPGEGIMAVYEKERVFAGKLDFLGDHGIAIPTEQRRLLEEKERELSVTAIGADGVFAGAATMRDAVRPFARAVVSATKALGVSSWVMLTGDNDRVAARVCKEVGIDEYKANLTPETKLKFIQTFKKTHPGVLAMMGDGVNDAASLALADVSVAMGVIGSDAAIEAADIALMHDSLERVPDAMRLGRQTLQIIRQNFIIWGVSNALGLVLVSVGILHPVGAAAYNFLTDFFPILNSLRVRIPRT